MLLTYYNSRKYIIDIPYWSEIYTFYTHIVYREKPGSDEQRLLDEQKVPLLLNFSQCQLIKGDWYQVIQHTTDVLKICPGKLSLIVDYL